MASIHLSVINIPVEMKFVASSYSSNVWLRLCRTKPSIPLRCTSIAFSAEAGVLSLGTYRRLMEDFRPPPLNPRPFPFFANNTVEILIRNWHNEFVSNAHENRKSCLSE